MIKFVKKAVSTLLASIMCIPTGIVNITNAAETNNPDGSYTVTLSDTENGLMQFSEESMNNSTASQDSYQMMQVNEDGEMEQIENDGSLWAFSSGDNVEIECIPNENFYVESLTLKDTETGDELAKKTTSNNVFSFSMPSKNVSVEAVFSSTTTIAIKDDKNSKSSDEIEYHDIVEEMDISKEEVEEVVADVITESYIKSNLNEEYITVSSDDIRMANVLYVKNTLFDGQYVEKNDTIDSIMGSIEARDEDRYKNLQKFITQLESYVLVYDLNASSDYYVAYANTLMKDSFYTVQDFCVAINSTDGIVIENECIYDEKTGLLYIPKELYRSESAEDKDIFMYLQIQFMQVFHQTGRNSGNLVSEDMTSEFHSISVDEDEEQIELSSYNQNIFSMQTDIQVDKGMDPDNLNVLVNGLPASEDAYTYDPETGNMTIEGSVASINSVEVTEGENSLSDELLDFIDETEAAWALTDLPSVMELPDPIEENFIEVLKQPIYGQTSVYYYNNESIPTGGGSYGNKGLRDDFPNANIYQTPSPASDGETGINAITNYINGADIDTNVQLEVYPEGTHRNYVYFVNLENFTAEGTITGGAMNNASLTEDQKREINEFVRELGQIGYLQCMCSHTAASVFGVDDRNNARPDGEPNAYVAIRLLYEQHDNKEGYFVFGIYNQEAKYTTQSGAGVFKVNYKLGSTSSKDPLYLYMYKKSAEGDKIKNATLENARFEMLFYADKYYNNAADALKKGTPTANFVFKTVKVSKVGSPEFKRIAKRDDIDADYGIDFFPKIGDDGYPIMDETTNPDKPLFQNDCILPEYKEAYTDYFGSDGTYVIREIEEPDGFKLEGEMSGVGKDTNGKDLPSTARVTEGLSLQLINKRMHKELFFSFHIFKFSKFYNFLLFLFIFLNNML